MNSRKNLQTELLRTMKWPLKKGSPEIEDLWVEFESITDDIAGPIFSYCKRGNVDYVFSGKHEGFKGIRTEADLIAWCNGVLKEFENKVDRLSTGTEKEVLHNKIKEIRELISHFYQSLTQASQENRRRSKENRRRSK